MMAIFKSLRYIDEDQSMISAVREDGSVKIVELAREPDLFEAASGGLFGDVLPFTPPAEPSEEEKRQARLDAFRMSADISKPKFCFGVHALGLLSDAELEAMAKGDWPKSFDHVVAGMSDEQKLKARVAWAATSEIPRLDPVLSMFVSAGVVTDDQLDTMFGWEE